MKLYYYSSKKEHGIVNDLKGSVCSNGDVYWVDEQHYKRYMESSYQPGNIKAKKFYFRPLSEEELSKLFPGKYVYEYTYPTNVALLTKFEVYNTSRPFNEKTNEYYDTYREAFGKMIKSGHFGLTNTPIDKIIIQNINSDYYTDPKGHSVLPTIVITQSGSVMPYSGYRVIKLR